MSEESQRNRRRVTKMLVSVTVMFAVSWLPIQVILLLKAFEMFDVTVTNISLQVKIKKN